MLLQPVDAGVPHVGEGIEGWPAPCNSSMSATMAGSGTVGRTAPPARWPDSPPSTGRCAPAPDGPWVQERVPLSTSSQSGWLNSCSAIPVAPRVRAPHPLWPPDPSAPPHPAQIEDHRHRLCPLCVVATGCGHGGCYKQGPERRSPPRQPEPPPCPCSTPRASFTCIAPPNPFNGYGVTFRTRP